MQLFRLSTKKFQSPQTGIPRKRFCLDCRLLAYLSALKNGKGQPKPPLPARGLSDSPDVCCAVVLLLALQPLDYVVRENLGGYTHSERKQKVCYVLQGRPPFRLGASQRKYYTIDFYKIPCYNQYAIKVCCNFQGSMAECRLRHSILSTGYILVDFCCVPYYDNDKGLVQSQGRPNG